MVDCRVFLSPANGQVTRSMCIPPICAHRDSVVGEFATIFRTEVVGFHLIHGRSTELAGKLIEKYFRLFSLRRFVRFVRFEGDWTATITFLEGELVTMENVAEQPFSTKWPVKVRELGGRELCWEYDHRRMATTACCWWIRQLGETLGSANDHYLELNTELPEAAVEELVIMLAGLMHNDMTIATDGPAGAERWKY
ncbi:hypothetical protein MVEN_01482400 [Mycena venus]|uniref:Uncharacterized protein n=1 Tax=Mycena venus TaxID=2733690 RepID=A0A8H6XTK8_9AGAR|nr:hypothetical protein MVEN_01482400 [Mycena venus]